MFFRVSYNDDFDTLMMHLWSKYGKELLNLDGIGKQLDMNLFSKEFFTNTTTTADISVDSNANVDSKDIIAYNAELPKAFFRYNAYYVLWRKLRQLYNHSTANRIIEMQLIGDIYINDFHGLQTAYCFNFSTYDIALFGLPMVKKIKSIPPKYLFSFKSQLEQFINIAGNSILGATGLADVFIVMAYYVDKILDTGKDAHYSFKGESDIWEYVKENIVSFIYTVNQPFRGGLQSPFTNISVYDDNFLNDLVSSYTFDGVVPKVDTIKKIQNLFLKVMNNEMSRTPITFPVTTACFTVDNEGNIIDEEFAKNIAYHNNEFGFINYYCGSSSTLSSCCRLRSDTNNEYFNSFGAGSSKIGSLGVVTVNLPRLAKKFIDNYDNGELTDFFTSIKLIVEDVARINNAKRHIIKKRIENDNMPLYKYGFMNINKQYSTVGLTGIYETCEILGYDLLTPEGKEFILNMLEVINTTNDKMQRQYGTPHNCEQVPAENSSIKLCLKDKHLKFDTGYDFYSNQFVPLIAKADMLDRINLQGLFDKHFSGGAICHINVEEKIADPMSEVDLIKTCAKKGVIYWAKNHNLQRCKNDHMSVGNGDKCNICGSEIIDNFTRVVGFLTNTKNWHKVRREQDYPNRQWY